MAKKQINTLGLTTGQAIQLLRLYNPELSFQGFADTVTETPGTHTENNAWIATETGIVFGINVTKGQIIIDTGVTYIAQLPYEITQYSIIKNLGWETLFSGGGIHLAKPIILSQEGDYLEFNVKPITAIEQQGRYSFGTKHYIVGVARGVFVGHGAADSITVRTQSGTWLVGSNSGIPTPGLSDSVYTKVKVSFEAGKCLVYYDDILVATGNDFGEVIIDGFGNRIGTWDAWNGYLKEISWRSKGINASYSSILEAPGVLFPGIDLVEPERGFLKEAQNNLLNELVEDVADVSNSSELLMSEIIRKDYYSAYNTNETLSTTSIDEVHLNSVGDFFELKFRTNKEVGGYGNYLGLIGQSSNIKNNFGYYSASSIWLREGSAYAYKEWNNLSLNRSEWHTIKIEVVEAGYELFINEISQGVKIKEAYFIIDNIGNAYPGYPQYYDIQYVTIKISGEEKTINPLAAHIGSENVLLKKFSESNTEVKYEKLYVDYIKDEKFIVYTQDKSVIDVYYGFEIFLDSSIGTEIDPIYYSHQWRLTASEKYRFDGVTMSPTDSILRSGESESVILINGKVDFTGGYHGDERIDIDIDSTVAFYLDGIKLSDLSASFQLKPGSEFIYVQRSSIHNAAEFENNKDTGLLATGSGVLSINEATSNFSVDGVDTGIKAWDVNGILSSVGSLTVSNVNGNWAISQVRVVDDSHEIIAHRFKKTTIKDGGYTTYNRYEFLSEQDLSLWYHGISCIYKDAAQYGYNENLKEVEFTGSSNNYLSAIGLRTLNTYNPLKKMSAKATSKVLSGFDDSLCEMFTWDRTYDSKYYRKTPGKITTAGFIMEGEMSVEFKSI